MKRNFCVRIVLSLTMFILLGCNQTPKTLEECLELKNKELASVVDSFESKAKQFPQDSNERRWLSRGVKALVDNDVERQAQIARAATGSIRTELGNARVQIDEINKRYQEYEGELRRAK